MSAQTGIEWTDRTLAYRCPRGIKDCQCGAKYCRWRVIPEDLMIREFSQTSVGKGM